MSWETEAEMIHRLLKAEVERVRAKLKTVKAETAKDPLKELMDIREMARLILRDSSLSAAQKSMKIAPLAKREKLAQAQVKHGWCIVKQLDKESEVKLQLANVEGIFKGWEYRIKMSRRSKEIKESTDDASN